MNEFNQKINQSGVGEESAIELRSAFNNFFNQAIEWKNKADGLVVTDASQKLEMKQAREGRLMLKSIRVAANKKRAEMKEESIKYGRAVQSVYNLIESTIKPIEEHLQSQEDFIKIQKEKELRRIAEIRANELMPYSEFVQPNLNLAEMSDDEYFAIRDLAKKLTEEKIKQQEAERLEQIQREQAEAAERARIQAENELLREQAEAREKELAEERARFEAEKKNAEEQARIEREEQQAKIEAERTERLRLEAEAESKRIEKERLEKEEADAARKAANAPDKDKMILFAKSIESLTASVEGEDAKNICNEAVKRLLAVALFVRDSVESL